MVDVYSALTLLEKAMRHASRSGTKPYCGRHHTNGYVTGVTCLCNLYYMRAYRLLVAAADAVHGKPAQHHGRRPRRPKRGAKHGRTAGTLAEV